MMAGMVERAVQIGLFRQREQQMALQAHLSGGAQAWGTDPADRERSEPSDIAGGHAWPDRTLVERASAPAPSTFRAGSRGAPQRCFLNVAGLLGAVPSTAPPNSAGRRAT
jgi:hypothetical protein